MAERTIQRLIAIADALDLAAPGHVAVAHTIRMNQHVPITQRAHFCSLSRLRMLIRRKRVRHSDTL